MKTVIILFITISLHNNGIEGMKVDMIARHHSLITEVNQADGCMKEETKKAKSCKKGKKFLPLLPFFAIFVSLYLSPLKAKV
jgi:hypothetical protein